VQDFTGPAWNITSEYPSISSNEFSHDLKEVDECVLRIQSDLTLLKPFIERIDAGEALDAQDLRKLISGFQALSARIDHSSILLYNLFSYVHFITSVNSNDEEAERMNASLMQRSANFQAITTPMDLFLDRCPEEILSLYLADALTSREEYSLRRSREMASIRLPEGEETLLTRMRTHGISSWGMLYDKISSSLQCSVDLPGKGVVKMGLSEASGLLRDPNELVRRAAWHAIQDAWKRDENSCAAVLNGITGWRLEEFKRRSQRRSVHFLDVPVHNAGIERKTLDAIMQAVSDKVEVGRSAVRAMAAVSGKTKLDPWDLLAGAMKTSNQTENRRTYKEGITLIRDAFAEVDPVLGDFVSMLDKNRWIEGRVLPTKRQGAYCGGFLKSRTPRVFQTYMGSISDIRTLAHEIGHAYHSWVMRDLPMAEIGYPMTLAETASIFAETVFGDSMAKSDDANSRYEIAWQNAQHAASFLVNIPARFEFEKSLNERRLETAFLSPQDLGDLTESAWKKWYGDTISQTERQFWMTKLHFSMGSRAFYNFPYTFGALFSLSIYARRAEHGSGFLPMYVNLLRDTGRMTAEDVAKKHLGEDLTKPEFWYKGIEVMQKQVTLFEKFVPTKRVGPDSGVPAERPHELTL
jgi:oligoendopeptidase F